MQPLVMAVLLLGVPSLVAAWLMGGGSRLKRLFAALARRALFWWVVAMAILANWCYVIARGN